MHDIAELYANDLRTRLAAARRYTVFPNGGGPPRSGAVPWKKVLAGRNPEVEAPWPEELALAIKTWPDHAFGTANAAILILWHRPGLTGINAGAKPIPPHFPNLGGVPHAHVVRYVPDRLPRDPSWDMLHKWLGRGLAEFKVPNPWAAVMVACLNDRPSETGKEDRLANRLALQPGGRLETICRLVRPLLILACGKPVRDAIDTVGWSWPGASLQAVYHPSTWEGFSKGQRHGSDIVVPLLRDWARTGVVPPTQNHF